MIEFSIGGKKRKFSFGLDVLGWVQKDSGLDLTDTEGMPISSLFFILIQPLVYRGHLREVRKAGEEIDFTYDDVERWIKDKGMYHKDIVSLWDYFNETTMDMTPKTEDSTKKDAKKK